MLVNHPQMSVAELPQDKSTWSTLPVAWGQLLTDRMGAPMSYSKKYQHWYAKLQGHPIHIRQSKENFNHMWIEILTKDTEAVARAIQQELTNGIIITQTPTNT